jgi:hypothetical protein
VKYVTRHYTNPWFDLRRPGRVTTSVCGILASLLLHAVLLAPVLLGTRASKLRPPIAQNLGSKVGATEAMTLELLTEPDPGTRRGDPTDNMTALHALSFSLMQTVVIHNVPQPTDVAGLEEQGEDENRSDQSLQDNPTQSMMEGRYHVQIDARIERAWLRPRSPISSDRFACRVRIVQDTTGHVQEIEIISCNGDSRWQKSLVRAIESASPLPAPPDPKVFSRKLILEFNSVPFFSGMDPEGFEPEPQTAMK